jgi:hypothetical protein
MSRGRAKTPETVVEHEAPRTVAHAQVYAELRVLRRIIKTEPTLEYRAWALVDESLDTLNTLNRMGDMAVGAVFDQEAQA